MKNFLKLMMVVVICLFAGGYLHKCQSPGSALSDVDGNGCVRDTAIYYDTIPYLLPNPKQKAEIGTSVVTVPVFSPGDKPAYTGRDSVDCGVISPGDKLAYTGRDSVKVEIPITQMEYEETEYHAWVSGYEPSLDSIFVYPKREVVTIKKPPKRWHIGPTVGFGYTPHGFEPYIGVSVTYSIISF